MKPYEPDEFGQHQIVLDDVPRRAVGLADWIPAETASRPAHDRGAWLYAPVGRARRRRGATAMAGLALVVAVAAYEGTASHTVHTPSAAVTAASMVAATGNGPGCVSDAVLAPIAAGAVGPRPLTPRDGVQAIAAFEAAYYLARDGGRARAVVTSTAAVPDASQIQQGIDSTPPATAYCARIQPLAPNSYLVELSEFRPGEPETAWRQRISTTQDSGHALITTIVAA